MHGPGPALPITETLYVRGIQCSGRGPHVAMESLKYARCGQESECFILIHLKLSLNSHSRLMATGQHDPGAPRHQLRQTPLLWLDPEAREPSTPNSPALSTLILRRHFGLGLIADGSRPPSSPCSQEDGEPSPQWADEEMEVQRGKANCPELHSKGRNGNPDPHLALSTTPIGQKIGEPGKS